MKKLRQYESCNFCSRDAMVIVKTMALVDKPMCIQCYRAFKFGLGIDECEFIESIPVTQVTTQQPQQS